MSDRFDSDSDASRVLAALRRRSPLVLVVALIAFAAAYIWSNNRPKQSSATSAILFVDSHLDEQLFNQVVTSSVDPARQAATNAALVHPPEVSTLVGKK